MTARFLIWVIVVLAACVGAQPASGQWASPYRDEPFSLSYEGMTELSELLELGAAEHELLVALHLDMLNAENAKREEVRAYIEKRRHDDDVNWREGFKLTIDLTHDLEENGERFFEDVKLIVDPERAVIVDHMHRRSRMGRWYEVIDNEVSGVSAFPLKLLMDKEIVIESRLRELIVLHAEEEKRLWEQFQRTYGAIMKIQELGRELDFEFDEAGPELFAEVGKAFKEALEQMHRLRDANEGLAESVMNTLDEEQRALFEAAWWEANYEDVQVPCPAERCVDLVLADEESSEELKAKVKEIRPVFDDRLRIARKMARIAKRKTDLTYELSMIIEGGDRDTELYDDAMERLLGVAESYASALKGVMTPEQRVRYGLDPGERQIGEPERLR